MKYRKKPVIIEAIQVDGTSSNVAEVEWFLRNVRHRRGVVDGNPGFERGWGFEIYTLEGVMLARPGDYIVRGVQGEFYPVKPDIFEATYEPAE